MEMLTFQYFFSKQQSEDNSLTLQGYNLLHTDL